MDGQTVIQVLEQASKVGLPLVLSTAVIAVATKYAWIWIGNQKTSTNENICKGSACPFRAVEDAYIPEDLLTHRFFLFLSSAISNRIPYLKIRDDGRRAMAQDFLHSHLTSVMSEFRNILDDKDLNELSPTELESLLVNAVHNAQRLAETDIMRIAFVRGGADPMLVYTAAFREAFAPTIEQINDHFNACCHSSWLGENNVAKVASAMDFLVSAYKRLLGDAEVTMGRLNGTITGQHYGGKTLGPCDAKRS